MARWKAVSKQATCGRCGKARATASMPAISLGRWCGAHVVESELHARGAAVEREDDAFALLGHVSLPALTANTGKSLPDLPTAGKQLEKNGRRHFGALHTEDGRKAAKRAV